VGGFVFSEYVGGDAAASPGVLLAFLVAGHHRIRPDRLRARTKDTAEKHLPGQETRNG
jgi:hypothetical protein